MQLFFLLFDERFVPYGAMNKRNNKNITGENTPGQPSDTNHAGILERINGVEDLRKLKGSDLDLLADDVRKYIIETISNTGGHLSSSLGVVELSIALHYTFNTPMDKIIWDVGHQAYTHKILTGRKEAFKTIRKFGGLSGFPKMSESDFDPYNVGHSSTSLSLAIGEAVGRDMKGANYKVVAVIGDGSMTAGMAFEALNQIGQLNNDIIIILNDNEHSISKNVGALSTYLTRLISGTYYNRFRRATMEFVRKIPRIGEPLYDFLYKMFSSFKGLLVPANLFRDLGLRYFGPVDGHNINELCTLFERVRKINYGPKLIHVLTQKGKGYRPAEMDPARFHGTGPFDRATGICPGGGGGETYSAIAGKTIANLACKDEKIVAITAAMKLGTGLNEFELCAPERFFDVGIAEQHAVTFAGALARTGMKPFVAIYSTFLQRAADQLIHDIGIMNLPVRFLIDRAGIVGDDGETHHGLFDIAIIKNIPNFIFLAPSDGEELRDMIHYAASHDTGPVAIRFPRGKADCGEFSYETARDFRPGRIKRLSRGKDCAIFAVGDMVHVAGEVRDILKKEGVDISVVNVLSIKPLDISGIERVIGETRCFITMENGIRSGGFGEYLLGGIDRKLCSKFLFPAAFPDEFITHGSLPDLFKLYGLDARSIAGKILKAWKRF